MCSHVDSRHQMIQDYQKAPYGTANDYHKSVCALPDFENDFGNEETFKMRGERSLGDHGCQMATARFLNHMCLALPASGLWLRYATLQNLIPSFPWIAPPRRPSTLAQSKERKGSNFAT